jgi:molecular chaperone HtpG
MGVPAVSAGAQDQTESKAETHVFQADVARLLHLMVHSVYSERDVFLRELISNAADACEKLRYEAIARPELIGDSPGFAITIALFPEDARLSVSDNGIGMSRSDLEQGLGTIASSGTRAFLDRVSAKDDAPGIGAHLIGQFGIGFYSAFMVAERVDVETRRAGETQAWRWSSDGKGSYEIAAIVGDAAPPHGTRVVLHLSEAGRAFLDAGRVERLIRDHSAAVAVPVDLIDKPGDAARRISEGAALWSRPKASIAASDYTEFYRELAHQFDEPVLTLHWHAEGRHDYDVLAFVPGSRPFDLFDPQRKGKVKLYVRRVLITPDADLLPGWLRFVRMVVDSVDLPLNVSREMIQESPILATIRKAVTSRIVQDLTKFAESEPEKYRSFWDNFGAVLKEGLYEDPERRDGLFTLARFASTSAAEPTRTLEAYVKALRPNQTAIYYLLGDDVKRLAASPQLEGYRARGIEVLLLPDPVDAFWVTTALGYDGKPFKSVSQGTADIEAVALLDEGSRQDRQVTSSLATLFAFVKQCLAGEVEDVRLSDRLAESPACLVASASGPDRHLQRLMAGHGQAVERAKPVLELNPTHPLIAGLAERLPNAKDKSLLEDAAWLLYEEARLIDGEAPVDPAALAKRMNRLIGIALG